MNRCFPAQGREGKGNERSLKLSDKGREGGNHKLGEDKGLSGKRNGKWKTGTVQDLSSNLKKELGGDLAHKNEEVRDFTDKTRGCTLLETGDGGRSGRKRTVVACWKGHRNRRKMEGRE